MSHQSQDNAELSSKLWMGDLEPYMDEDYLKSVFAYFGYHVQGVKWVHHRHTMAVARYCFVIFNDHIVARQVLDKLNNQPIPGTAGKYFKLNWASKKVDEGQQDYTIFVGDLSRDVTSQMLQEFFQQYYQSVRFAKVIEDENGVSKGYGFVRFLDEVERNHSFCHLNRASGLGKKFITVREASAPKSRSSVTTPSPTTPHPPLSSPSPVAVTPTLTPPFITYPPTTFWTSGMVVDPIQQQQLCPAGHHYPYSVQVQGPTTISPSCAYQHPMMNYTSAEDLVEPSTLLDIEEINRETFHRDNELYRQLDSIRWITKQSQQLVT